MTHRSAFLGAAVAAVTLLLGSDAAHAGGWRCMDRPDESSCDDDLINDIEDVVEAEWPTPFRVAMPPLPYSCSFTSDRGGGRPLVPDGNVQLSAARSEPWSIELRNLSSFLLGRNTAAVQLAGPLIVDGGIRLRDEQWTGVHLGYVFEESSAVVTHDGGGQTGVSDLGGIRSTAAGGAFWSGNLRFDYSGVSDGLYQCTVGYPGRQITRSGINGVVIDYPVASTPVHEVLAEAIREQFRQAVRLVVPL